MNLTYFKKNKMALSLILSIISCCMISCKPTTKNEIEQWQKNLVAVDKLTQEATTFATPIAAVKERASVAWTAAEKITEEDKKAEAMHAANQIINDGFVGHLIKIPSMQTEISDIKDKLADKTMAQSLIAKLNDEVDRTKAAYKLYDKAMENGASNEAAAEAIVTPAYSAVSSSLNNWKSYYSEYKRENDKKKK